MPNWKVRLRQPISTPDTPRRSGTGDTDAAYRALRGASGPDPVRLRSDVLEEILIGLAPAGLLAWVKQVHLTFESASHRGPMWACAQHRLRELSGEQHMALLDQWLDETPNRSRADVLADVLFYRDAIERLSGREECARLLELVERREAQDAAAASRAHGRPDTTSI
jgi:hypothetical protein